MSECCVTRDFKGSVFSSPHMTRHWEASSMCIASILCAGEKSVTEESFHLVGWEKVGQVKLLRMRNNN